jgi:5-methylcytosine-specific restriction endonuclease McrA
MCGSHSNTVIDHKNDLYNDETVLNVDTQTIDDFQVLCTHCNLLKRQISIDEKKIKKFIVQKI